MSSKIRIKSVLLGLLSLGALGVAQDGRQNGLQPEAFGPTNEGLEAVQRFQQPRQRFSDYRQGGGNMNSGPSTSSRSGGSGRFSNNRLSDPSRFDDDENQIDDENQLDDEGYQDDEEPFVRYGGNNGKYEDPRMYGNRRRPGNHRHRPSQSGSSRFQGGNGQGQSPNPNGAWRGQPGQPIIFNPPGTRQICPFDDQKGPNILIAEVSVPSSPPKTEIVAWSFGDDWCSHAHSIADTQDICSLQDGREFMHVPLTDKFGALDPLCYANFKVWFDDCRNNWDGTVNYDSVTATFLNTDTDEVVVYECAQNSEYRGCLYNGQLPQPTQTGLEAFLVCGIKAQP